jgi:phenylacetate-CoA ligase
MRAFLAANLLYYPVTRLAGERVRRYLREYRSNDTLSVAALRDRQAHALDQIVCHAQRSTAHHAQSLNDRSAAWPSAWLALNGLPPVEKSWLREHPERFISSSAPGRHERKTTSGSTGHPLTILKNRDALARERAATWRAYGWAGIPVLAPQALLWGLPHSTKGRARARLLDVLSNRKRLSMFGVREEDLARYHAVLLRFRPHYLYGYASALLEFVRFLEASRRALPSSVTCLVSTSELLDSATRRFLEERTGLRVFNEYGCGEVGSIAHECEEGGLHVMADNLVVECLPGEGLPEGLGELVVTDLHNMAMPMIRYRVGDLGELSDTICRCGRPYPLLKRIVGRAYDTLVGVSGRKYHPEAVLYIFEDLRRVGVELPPFQVVQSRNGHLLVNFEATLRRWTKSRTDSRSSLIRRSRGICTCVLGW